MPLMTMPALPDDFGPAGVEVVEEPVDDPALPGLVIQRLADDLARELHRERADLAAQRRERLLAVGRRSACARPR